MNQLYQKLGEKFCKALPAYHAVTGCDYTASFSRKGKIRPLKLLEKDEEIQEAFGKIGMGEIDVEILSVIERSGQ